MDREITIVDANDAQGRINEFLKANNLDPFKDGAEDIEPWWPESIKEDIAIRDEFWRRAEEAGIQP